MKNLYILVVLIVLSIPVILHAQIERWVYTYDGSANSSDCAQSIVFGYDGNIYAAGYTTGSGTASDLTVISLTPSGGERWIYTYDGPVNGNDAATSLTCGPDSNLYITGTSVGVNYNDDIIVVSLDAEGDERWVYRYDGSGNADDNANAITCGLDDNLYIAGGSYGTADNIDFMIISVDTGGSEQWVYRYNGAGYDSGPEEAYDVAYGMDGNIYAAGYTYSWIWWLGFAVISVDTSGDFRWRISCGNGTAPEEALSITCGVDTNVYVVGYASFNFGVSSYSAAGGYRWSYWYEGISPNSSKALAVAYGLDDDVYVCGYWDSDAVALSLSNDGDTNWVYLYSGPVMAANDFCDIVEGSGQTIFAAGWSPGDGTGDDMLVAAVDTSGTERWVYRYNGNAGSGDRAYSLAYGLDDNLYVTGYTTGSGSGTDFTVISLDTTATSVVEYTPEIVSMGTMHITPNPFRDHIEIRWQMPSRVDTREQLDCSIDIYNATGRVVKSFRLTPDALRTTVTWDGTDQADHALPSGVYFLKLKAGEYTTTRKLLLIR